MSQARARMALQYKLRFSVSTDQPTDSNSLLSENTNLKKVPRWSPAQVAEMVDATPPTLTKDELVTEIQSLATDDWLARNALDGTDRVAGCSVSVLLDKYRFLCEAPLLTPSRVTVKTVQTISELVGVMSRAGLQAVQLLGACHTLCWWLLHQQPAPIGSCPSIRRGMLLQS